MESVLSLGDCNTCGIAPCEGNAYPERFAQLLGGVVRNCGYTMSTMREASYFFRDFYTHDTTIVTLQYGLVDSWETFAYAPYVLYYPDNLVRKLCRKVVKRYKKLCRQTGLNTWLGSAPLVPVEEYARRLTQIIEACRPDTRILLIETVPNRNESRNPAIRRYNDALRNVAAAHPRCQALDTYDWFATHRDTLYLDDTHINAQGHEWISRGLLDLCSNAEGAA
ncbi:MAG: SGNH/GDSL hydrolase family protein [Lentisphaerae bacterium]|nr:SGNH/GDSL hydrolase family protein [Lentisphaerota bacterium]